jgi:integrase/recombinase XerD
VRWYVIGDWQRTKRRTATIAPRGWGCINHLFGKNTSNQLFLCLNAPYRAFAKSSSVADIVRAALLRAGIENPPSYSAHLLRHSAATALLRAGATLVTVAAVLRHRSLNMTAYYAKVDIPSLMKIAQPWPKVASC